MCFLYLVTLDMSHFMLNTWHSHFSGSCVCHPIPLWILHNLPYLPAFVELCCCPHDPVSWTLCSLLWEVMEKLQTFILELLLQPDKQRGKRSWREWSKLLFKTDLELLADKNLTLSFPFSPDISSPALSWLVERSLVCKIKQSLLLASRAKE